MPAEFVALADLLRDAAAASPPDAVPHDGTLHERIAPPHDGTLHERVARDAHRDDTAALATAETVPASAAAARPPADRPAAAVGEATDTVADAVREARLFRARLRDAFDGALARLLRDLACDVLARELRIAPCALAEIVRRVRERAPVVRVRVAPSDLAALQDAGACGDSRAPNDAGALDDTVVVAEASLQPGDAVIELAGGALDARLGLRLATVLEAFTRPATVRR